MSNEIDAALVGFVLNGVNILAVFVHALDAADLGEVDGFDASAIATLQG